MDDKLIEKIHIDEESEKLIRFTFKQYRVMAVLWITISMAAFTVSVIRIIKYQNYPINNWLEFFNIKVYPALFFITTAASIFQLYNYYSAIKFQNRAISESDQHFFSKSFAFYKKGNLLSIVILCITLFSDLILLYQELQVSSSI